MVEVNVFSPGDSTICSKLAGINFAETILASIGRKVEIDRAYAGGFDNRSLAVR